MYNLSVWLHELELDSTVWAYNEFEKVITVISTMSGESYVVGEFNRWNESNGIQYSIVRIKHDVFIIYPKNNNGVQVSDLAN